MKLCHKNFRLPKASYSSYKLVRERKSQDLLLVLEIWNLMYITLFSIKKVENRLWEKPELSFKSYFCF